MYLLVLDEAALGRIVDAVETRPPSAREDRIDRLPLSVTLNQDYLGYSNTRTTRCVDSLARGLVSHVKFIPMPNDGWVIMLAAQPNERGAEPFVRIAGRRTGTVNLRDALSAFSLRFSSNRKLRLPVQPLTLEKPGSEPRKVALILVKETRTEKRRRRQPRPADAAG